MLRLMPHSAKPSYEDVFSANHSKVVQYINKKIGNLSDAEDLASEVFLYAYKHYDEYDPQKSSVNTWLYLIVNSRLKNHYRDAKAYVDLETVVGVLEDESVDLDKCIYLEEVGLQLRKAIACLPERQARIVTMRYFDQRSCGEIAEALDMTPGNVRVQLSRALDKLENLCANILEGDR